MQLWLAFHLVPSQFHELLKVDNPIHCASTIISHYFEYLFRSQHLIHRLLPPRPLTWWTMHDGLTDILFRSVDQQLTRTSASLTSIAPYFVKWLATNAILSLHGFYSPSCSTLWVKGIQLETAYILEIKWTRILYFSMHMANCLLQNSLNLELLEQKTYFESDSGPLVKAKWQTLHLGNCLHTTSFGFLQFGKIDHCWHAAWLVHSIGQLLRWDQSSTHDS